MNVKQLKEILSKLPDDVEAVVSHDGVEYLPAGAQTRFAVKIDRRGIPCLMHDHTEVGHKVLLVYWYH